jgi:hypothetical protein
VKLTMGSDTNQNHIPAMPVIIFIGCRLRYFVSQIIFHYKIKDHEKVTCYTIYFTCAGLRGPKMGEKL